MNAQRVLSTVLAVILTLCTGFSTTQAQEKTFDKIVIAVQPSASPEQLASQSKEVEAVLKAKLGKDVELLFPSNYAGVIEALRFGHAQAAFMGSWPALLAVTKADAKVLLAEVRDVFVDDKKVEGAFYYSYWIVMPESPYKTLAELKGKKAAFPSLISSSGYVAPLSKLVELGYVAPKEGQPADAKDYFSEVMFSGGYAQGWEALKAGQVDVTVIAGDVPSKLYEEVLKGSRVVEKQGPIPSHAVVVAADVPDALRAQLKEAFMEFNKPEYKPLMLKFISGIFVRFQDADEAHLASLKDMVEATKLEFTDKK